MYLLKYHWHSRSNGIKIYILQAKRTSSSLQTTLKHIYQTSKEIRPNVLMLLICVWKSRRQQSPCMADVRPDRRLTTEPEASRLLSSKQSNGESRLVSSDCGSPDSNPPPRWLPVVSVILPWLEMSETHLQKAALKDEDQDDLSWVFLYMHSSILAIHPNVRCSDIFTEAIRTKAVISIVDGG